MNKTLLPIVTVGDKVLKWKASVIYLGSCFSEHGITQVAVKHRICCAESVVKRLNERVFQRRGVGSLLKGHFIDIAVFSSLLYGLEHCAVRVQDRRCIDGFFLRLAKRVLHLRYDYHLSYEEAETRLGIRRPSARLTQERLRWTGHMLRSDDEVLREVLAFVPAGGARGRGRPRLRFYDTVKLNLKATQEQFWDRVKGLADSRQDWRNIVEG